MVSPYVGGRYRHFKGRTYKVLHVAFDSGNPDKKFVIYTSDYQTENPIVWSRSLEEFMETVIVNDLVKSRFEYLGV